MTNRDILNKLSNRELTYFILNKLLRIGKQYNNSQYGIEAWLSEQANEEFWIAFNNECFEYGKACR